MPKSTRVTCHACRARLGVVLNDRLVIERHRVEIGPRHEILIYCTTCGAVRPWLEKRPA